MCCDEIVLPFCCFVRRKLKLDGDAMMMMSAAISIPTFNFETVLFTPTLKFSDPISRLVSQYDHRSQSREEGRSITYKALILCRNLGSRC